MEQYAQIAVSAWYAAIAIVIDAKKTAVRELYVQTAVNAWYAAVVNVTDAKKTAVRERSAQTAASAWYAAWNARHVIHTAASVAVNAAPRYGAKRYIPATRV